MNKSIVRKNKEVLIVGAGPVGLTAACLLLSQNVPCRVIEKRSKLSNNSKALSINAATLKMLDSMNIAKRFLRQGERVKDIYAYWNNHRIMHVDYGRLRGPYPYFLSLPQPKSEKILSDYCVELGGKIERQVSLTDIQVTEEKTEVTLLHDDGQVEENKYNYVIACDGGRSTVRERLQLRFDGHNYGIYFRLIDVFIDWDGPINDTHYFVKEDGFIIVIPMAGGFHRIVIKEDSVHAGNKNETLSLKDYQKLVDYYGPGDIHLKGDLIWESSAPFYNRLIENYHYKHRVFFAGDAAHLFSPIGGQGMNTGLQDVNNLAWKLAGVIKYGWNSKILHTYSDERHYIGKCLIDSTDDSTQLIARLEKNDNEKISQWMPIMKNRENIRSHYPMLFSGLVQRYPKTSFVNNMSGNGIKADLVGKHLPYVKLDKNCSSLKSTYDILGNLPVLLVFSESCGYITQLADKHKFKLYQIVECHNDEFENEEDVLFDAGKSIKNKFMAESNDVFLIRPDGFVGFKSNTNQINQLQEYMSAWYEC